MPVLVIYNPVSGDRSSKALFDDHILPLLAAHSITPDRIVPTESPGHAGTIVADFLSSIPDASQALPVTVILGSGDGTLHELINALNSIPTDQPLPRIHLALVPCGTANALYSSIFPPSPNDDPAEYKLKSVKAFVSTKHASLPLNLAVTVLSAPPITSPGQQHPSKRVAISAVVASTALHASILHDSEALRASDPSIERFKTAARQNITRWYHASVKLFPREGAGFVEIYDPASRAFVQHESSTEDEPIVDLEGPFAYFLSTVNVDRLEPAFKITPRGKDVPSPAEKSAALDVVIVRPTRDPRYEMDSEETRAAFVEKAGAVLGAAYQDGAHVALRYDPDGKVTTEGTGPTVVEYVRCGGWEWEPDDIDERAHFVCADGDILTIPKGGKATCTAATPMGDTTGFALYV
ncbi:ATP-NAD kinase-like domain-containing protein [Earliella scabrosa]|nr:ATP-NAD kinase-like domain-containing protein [Earliella scabrosa]